MSDKAIIENAIANPAEALHQLEAIRCEESLYEFIKAAWHTIHPGTEFEGGWAIETMCRHLEAVTRGDVTRLLINVPPGCTKAAPIDTPVLTPSGWVRHGDLREGDFVFAPNGKAVRVQGITPRFDTPTYRVEFKDGVSVDVSQAHEWILSNGKRVETRDLRTGSRPDSLSVGHPVEMPRQHGQVIHPYLLGAWLGDGDSASGMITAHMDDAYVLVENHGAVVSRRDRDVLRLRVPGLQEKLRILDLLHNKHIPDAYSLGSIEQRWELLRGLLDTDGMATDNGSVRFSQKDEGLALQVQQLANSLGLKCSCKKKSNRLGNKTFQHHLLVISPREGDVYFYLDRKQERTRMSRNCRGRRRYVERVTVLPSKVMSCIQVEGGQYLIGENLIPTSNSMLVNVFWPAWEWGPKNFKHYKYISAAHEKGLIIDLMARAREVLKSEWYQSHWPLEFKPDADGKEYYATTDQGSRFAASVTSKLTGRRGHRFIIDDPHSVASAESDAERVKAGSWFTETTPTRFDDQKNPVYVIIMQRLHMNDISGIVIDKLADQQGWTHVCLPMEFEEKYRSYSKVPSPFGEAEPMRRVVDEDSPLPHYVPDPDGEMLYPQDPREEEHELLWPERFPRESIEELKIQFRSEGGSYAESAQLQQRPVPRGGGMFKKEWFKYLDKVPEDVILWCRGYDLAATEKNPQAAYTASVKLGLRSDGSLVVADVQRDRFGPADVERNILSNAERDGHAVNISVPQDPGQAGKSQVNAFARQMHGYNFRSSPETGSKPNRAIPIAAQAEIGNVYLVRGPWNDVFLGEACLFPNSKFLDQVDALSRAYEYILANKGQSLALIPGRTVQYG